MRNIFQLSQCLSITRIITGLIAAPFLGLLLYFMVSSIHFPFSFDAFSSSVINSMISFLLIVSNLGPLFLVLVVLSGTVVMLLLMKFYSCNVAVCVIGAVVNAILAAILFLIMIVLTGAEFMIALAGFALLLSLIIIPAILAGILFWCIVVFKNTVIRMHWTMDAS